MEKVSIIIPCYKSAQTITEVVTQTRKIVEDLRFDYEFILVNDGSPDDTFFVISQLCKADKKIIGLNLAKNFGQHNAIMAALNVAHGDLVLGMDDDLQTHPTQIPRLFEKLQEGFDVVYAIYPEKKHSLYRNIGSRFYQWTMRILTGRPADIRTSSFWLAKKFVCDQVIRYTAPHPHISALVFRATNNVGNITVEHFDRVVGESGYTFKKLIKLWSTSINFSIVPLRIVTTIGFICGCIGFIATAYIAISKLLFPSVVLGWSSLMAVLLFTTGIIVFSIGMVGEYVGRLFVGESSFPQYVIRESINGDQAEPDVAPKP